LNVSAGETEAAFGLYRLAVDELVDADRPLSVETLKRSMGVLALRLGRPQEAEVIFREGLEEALQARSAHGVKVHGCSFQNVTFLAQRTGFMAQAAQLVALGGGQAITSAGIDIGLCHPRRTAVSVRSNSRHTSPTSSTVRALNS
jgi:hypothetical protein